MFFVPELSPEGFVRPFHRLNPVREGLLEVLVVVDHLRIGAEIQESHKHVPHPELPSLERVFLQEIQ